MTPKQKRFADEYLIDLNGTQAAIRAGYSPRTAQQQSYELLLKPFIADYLKERSQSIADKLGIDASYVLGSVKKVAERSLQAEAVLDREGNETGEWTFNAQGANKSLELLGKHLKLWQDDDKKLQQNITINILDF